jgi:hypothetical protein
VCAWIDVGSRLGGVGAEHGEYFVDCAWHLCFEIFFLKKLIFYFFILN